MQHSTSDPILEKYLRWLGHVGYMHKERLQNRQLFGEKIEGYCENGFADRWYELCQVMLAWFHRCCNHAEIFHYPGNGIPA